MGLSKVLTTLLQVQCSRQLSLLELSSFLRLFLSWESPTFQHCDFFFKAPQQVCIYCSIWTPFFLCSAPTLPSPKKRLTLRQPTLQLLFLHLSHPPMFLVFLRLLSFPNSLRLRVLQYNARGLQVISAELFHFISILSAICIKESNFNSFFSLWIHGYPALRFDRTYSRSSFFSCLPACQWWCHHFCLAGLIFLLFLYLLSFFV